MLLFKGHLAVVISLILWIGCLCQAKTVILGGNFVDATFVTSKHWWRNVSGSIASILFKAPWLQHTHTHTPPPPRPAPIPGILPCATGEKTFSLISFNTSKILMTFGTSSILYLVFTWLQEEQVCWSLAFLTPAYSSWGCGWSCIFGRVVIIVLFSSLPHHLAYF